MDALILAAGLGTRLGAIGEATPKALLEVGGRTLLEHVATRLVAAGVDRIIVNAHHHADRIADFVASHDLGAEVLLSFERERPLETGGALLQARDHFRRDAPFFVHNVDVLTEADLGALSAAHRRSGAIATLAVSDRTSARRLLFDDDGLYGRVDHGRGVRIELRPPRGTGTEWAFAGIHIASPELLDRIDERGAFSILTPYLRLAEEGARIGAHSIGEALWLEVGTPERLERARAVYAGKEVAGGSG